MPRWTPAATDVLDAVASEILHNYGRGRAVVAVDGLSIAATGTMADELAAAVSRAGHAVVRASLADFAPSDEQRTSPDTTERTTDAAAASFRSLLSEPFLSRQPRPFTTSPRSGPSETDAPTDCLLIVDGVYLKNPSVAGLWNYSVWLDTAHDAVITDADRAYLRAVGPRAAASAALNVEDPEHPRRIFADSC